jgi:hypothetical protein
MSSKSHQLLETPFMAPRAEAVSMNHLSTKASNSDVKNPVTGKEKDVQDVRGFKLYAVLSGATPAIFCHMLGQTAIFTAIPRSVQVHSLEDLGKHPFAACLA